MRHFVLLLGFIFFTQFALADGCTSVSFIMTATPNSYCSYDFQGLSVQNTDCDYSQPYTYYWDFGDGSSLVYGTLNPQHQYFLSGTYTVTLTFEGICHGQPTICYTEQLVTVVIPPPPSISSSVSIYSYNNLDFNVSCSGANDGWISLISSGAYTFEWQTTPLQYGSTINNLSAGSYDVLAILNGCPTQTPTFNLIEPPAIIDNGLVQNSSCFNADDAYINISASGGIPPYIYSWNTGDTTEDISNLAPGDYFLYITDITTCNYDSFYFQITEPVQLTSFVTAIDYNGYNISCFGFSDGAIDLNVNGGTYPYSYIWNTGEISEDISNVPSGYYSVDIIDYNGCTLQQSITLIQPPPIVTNIESLTNFNGYDISCNGFSDGSINLSASGAYPPFSYNWNTGETSEDLDSLIAGIYTVTITDTNGCPHITYIELIEPSLLVDSIESVYNYNNYEISCYDYNDGAINLSVYGAVSPYYYEWSNLSNSQDISNLSEGWYFVDITDANGCDISDSIFLAQPTPLEIDIQSNTNYNGYDIRCHGNSDGSINLTVTGSVPGYIYLWNNNDAIEDPINLPAGAYDVFVTDQNFCTIDTAIILYQPEKLIWDAEVYPDTCEQQVGKIENVQISGGAPGYILSWLNVNPPPIAVQLLGGEYHIEIKDSNNCLLNDTIVILNLGHPDEMVFSIISSPKHLYDQLFDPIVFIDMTNTFPFWNKVTNWDWDFGDQTYSTDSVAFHSYQAIGDYDVILQLTTDHKCIDTLVRKVVIKEYDLFIPDAFTPNSDDNINKGFRPYGIGIDEFLMNIYTRWGGLVYSTTNIEEEWNGRFKNSEEECQLGVYTYYIEVKDTFGATHKYIGKVHLIR